MLVDFDFEQPHFAAREFVHVQSRRRHQYPINFVRGNHFGIEHQVDVKIFLEIIFSLAQKLHVADTGNRVADAVLFGKNAGNHVDFVGARDGNEHVRAVYVGVVHCYGARAVCGDCQHVQIIFHGGKLTFLAVDNRNRHLLTAQKFGDCVTEFARADNYHAHEITPLREKFRLVYVRLVAAST